MNLEAPGSPIGLPERAAAWLRIRKGSVSGVVKRSGFASMASVKGRYAWDGKNARLPEAPHTHCLCGLHCSGSVAQHGAKHHVLQARSQQRHDLQER